LRHLDIGARRRRVAGGVVAHQSTTRSIAMMSLMFRFH
jgi:hypothetical protein